MAPVESSFTKTINSFIHERGCAAAGHLFIVCLLNVCLYEAAGGPQKDQLNLKKSCPKLFLSSMSNNEMNSNMVSHMPCCETRNVLVWFSSWFFFTKLNEQMGIIFCLEKYVWSSANRSTNYIFVLWTLVLDRNATIPVLPWRGGRVYGLALTM